MQQVNIELFKNAVAFTMTIRKFNNRRQGDMAKVQTDADKSRLKISKELIVSKELEEINTFLADTYKWCTNRSVPSFFKDGLYLVKLSEVENFEKKLSEARQKLMAELVPAMIRVYPAQIDAAREALNGQFRQDDYPAVTELPFKFGIEWNWIAFGVPENLPEELKQAEAAKIEKRFAEAEEQIREALLKGFSEIIVHVTDRLTVEPGGKQKIFRDSLFEELTEFIGTFNARNLVNDSALEEVVKQAQAILSKVKGSEAKDKAQAVRGSETIREQTAEAFGKIKERMGQIIIEKPGRKFDFSE